MQYLTVITLVVLNLTLFISLTVAADDLVLVFKDDAAQIYFNKMIDKSKTKWIFSLYSKGWKHVKTNFGNFGKSDGRLTGTVQATSDEGGMATSISAQDASIYMDLSPGSITKDRNLYDKAGTNRPNQRLLFDFEVGAIADIVEGGNNRMEGSPATSVWGAKGFKVIMIYDLFLNIGYTKEAEEWKKRNWNEATDAATAKNIVYWLKDFWTPIYDNYGKTAVLARFFKLCSQYWPKERGNQSKYKGEMDVGQFIHFMSGAANKNLKELATSALGWEQEDEDSFNKARKDFPKITY